MGQLRSASLIVAVAVAIAGPAAAAPSPGGAYARCERLVRAKPGDFASYQCYLDSARGGAPAGEAIRILDGLLRREPGNDHARVTLARLERDAGGERSERLFREAADGFSRSSMQLGEVYARLDLAALLLRSGRRAEAEEEASRAQDVAGESGAASLIRAALSMKAELAFGAADYGEALRRFRSLEADKTPDDNPLLRASILNGLGRTLWALGRYAESYAYFARLREQHRSEGNRFAEASDLYNLSLLSSLLQRSGRTTDVETRSLIRAALDASVAARDRSTEAAVRLELAQETSSTFQDRMREAGTALDLARAGRNGVQECFALRLLASLSLASDPSQRDRALALSQQAIDRSRALGSLHDEARGRIVRAQIRMKAEPGSTAIVEALQALDAIERIRHRQSDDLARARVGSQWAYFYYRVAGYVLGAYPASPGPHDPDLAFRVMERLRGRILLEHLAAAGREIPDPGTAVDEPVSVEEVRRSLEPDEALLAYQVPPTPGPGITKDIFPEGGSWVFTVTRDGARVHRLDEEDDLEEIVPVLLGLVQRRDGSEIEGAARLHRLLLKPALEDLPEEVTRLIIVPDRSLYRVPFDALGPDDGSGRLGDRYETSMVPSASLWVRWRRDRLAARSGALALADPRPAGTGGDMAPSRSAAGPELRGPGSLPQARREARLVVRAIGGASLARVGADASEGFLKAGGFSPFGLIHVASHAIVDDRSAESTALLLAPGGGDEDGLLRFGEIAHLDLQGRIVVLSACGTSSGTILHGEGVMSLARAFFMAGARAVVGTLWPVRDDEALDLVAGMYRRLGAGATVGAALAGARRERSRAGAPAAAWAGFVTLGDAGAALRPEAGTRMPIAAVTLIGALVASAALALLVARWGRRRRPRAS